MAGAMQKKTILLNGGLDNRSWDEMISPIVEHGGAPKLTASTNTRLNKTPGVPVRPPAFAVTGTSGYPPVMAMSSSTSGKRTLTLTEPQYPFTPYVICDGDRKPSGSGPLSAPASPYRSDKLQSVYAARITASIPVCSLGVGENSGTPADQFTPAVAANATLGLAAVASAFEDSSGQYAVVEVVGLDGEDIAPPVRVAQYNPIHTVAVTAHGSNGFAFWYLNAAGSLRVRTVTVAGAAITLGTDNAVATPSSIDFDVCRIDDTTAAVSTTIGGVVKLLIVTVSTGSILANPTAASAGAVSSGTLGGTTFVVCGSGVVQRYTTDGTLVWTSGAGLGGRCLFVFSDGTTDLIVSANDVNPDADHRHIELKFMNAATGATVGSTTFIPWMKLYATATDSWYASATRIYPIIPVRKTFGSSNEHDTTNHNYIDDPSLDLLMVTGIADNYSVIARMGTVRGTYHGAYIRTDPANTCVSVAGNKALCVYTEDGNSPRIGRLTTVDMRTRSPAGDASMDGCGLIPCALPMQFDGVTPSELGCPLNTPRARLATTAGGPSQWMATAVYQFLAVYEWDDAAGVFHRSRPSNLITRTAGSPTEVNTITVQCPQSLADVEYNCSLYVSEGDGSTLHLDQTIRLPKIDAMDATNDEFVFVARPGSSANAQIYSAQEVGDEIAPQPPPPLHDIAVVSDRYCGIDAEYRHRVAFSKAAVPGRAPEFVPAFEVLVPNDSAVAVREFAGAMIIICERSVYQVSGTGPSPVLGGGGSYYPPVKIADIGCTNVNSVVRTPVGIVWQTGERFASLTSQGVRYLDGISESGNVTSHALFTRYGEIVYFSASATEALVYSYEVDKWSKWDSTTLLGSKIQACTVLPWDTDIALAHSDTAGGPRRIDASTTAAISSSMTLETDWIALGGDFQDEVCLHYLIFNGYRVGTSSVTVQVMTDYNTVFPDTSTTFASEDIIDVEDRFTVRIEPATVTCRVVKVRIVDASQNSSGAIPRSLTFVYSVSGLMREDALYQGSEK